MLPKILTGRFDGSLPPPRYLCLDFLLCLRNPLQVGLVVSSQDSQGVKLELRAEIVFLEHGGEIRHRLEGQKDDVICHFLRFHLRPVLAYVQFLVRFRTDRLPCLPQMASVDGPMRPVLRTVLPLIEMANEPQFPDVPGFVLISPYQTLSRARFRKIPRNQRIPHSIPRSARRLDTDRRG